MKTLTAVYNNPFVFNFNNSLEKLLLNSRNTKKTEIILEDQLLASFSHDEYGIILLETKNSAFYVTVPKLDSESPSISFEAAWDYLFQLIQTLSKPVIEYYILHHKK